MSETLVETTLRGQRDAWSEVVERVSSISSRELPHEQPKRILLFGLGSSHFAAKLSAFALLRDKSRLRTPVISCTSMSIGTEIIPAPGDWAFAFSHRGTSKPTEAALSLCERSGAFTIEVCAKDARVMESARYVLPTVPMEKIEPHTIAVTSAICAVTTMLIGQKAAEEWEALRSIGTPDLEYLRRKVGQGPQVVLGEWEGEWLAREGALKLMEMARLPVRAFGSEEFFHGPRFSHGKSDSIWHVSAPKDPREGEIQASQTVRVSGGTSLAFIPALVELQWMALAVALNRGVNPDDPTA